MKGLTFGMTSAIEAERRRLREPLAPAGEPPQAPLLPELLPRPRDDDDGDDNSYRVVLSELGSWSFQR